MKILFVGDVHNHMYMFKDIERLDSQYNFDRIIFLGDYVDDWMTNNDNSTETINKVIALKKSAPNKYTFTLGNHELSYLGFPCSGHDYINDNLLRLLIIQNIDVFDLYTTVELADKTFYCSHAGFTNDYLINELQPENTKWEDNMWMLKNDILSRLELLVPCSYLRGGKYPYSSFVWADMRELMYQQDELFFPNQIVGHTPVSKIYHHTEHNADLYFLDTHSTYRDGTPFGNKSYLVWNDDRFIEEM